MEFAKEIQLDNIFRNNNNNVNKKTSGLSL